MSRTVLAVLLVALAGFAAALPRDIARRERQKRISIVPSPPNKCAFIQCDIPKCVTKIIYPDPSSGECCPYCADSCDSIECDKGEACRIFSTTGEAYCDPDCSVENGGCEADQICIQALALCSSNSRSPCPGAVACVDNNTNSCPDGSQPVNCFANPCDVTTCPNHPNATCKADYCGGCYALFFDSDDNEVTKTCRSPEEKLCDVKGQVFQECQPCPSTCSNLQISCDLQCTPGCGCPPGQVIDELTNSCIDRANCPELPQPPFPPLPPPVPCPLRPCRLPANCSIIVPPGPFEPCACPTCGDGKKPDCSAALCPARYCDNPLPPAPGQCCPRCPDVEDPFPRTDICELPPDGGPCEAYSEQYFYNSTSEACEVFIYGGCDGNENRFPSVGECKRACTDQKRVIDCRAVRCAAPTCPDPIRADPSNGTCCDTCPEGSSCPFKGQFYQGCGSRCLATCADPFPICVLVCSPGCHCPSGQVVNEDTGSCVPVEECPDDEPTSICQLPVESGNCSAQIKRFYFNSGSGKCESFVYGGCNGNKNNFLTRKKCRKECEPPKKPQVDCSAVLCAVPTCPDPIPPNPAKGECCSVCPPGSTCPVKGQIYSQCKACEVTCANNGEVIPCPAICAPGCQCPQGQVIDEKSNTCMLPEECPELDTCEQSPEVGLCKALFQRYFYNATSKQCERFIYGGCGGNDNNFETLASCEKKCSECAPTCTPDFCKGNKKAKCSIPEKAPDAGSCFGDCDETVCNACYYSNETLSLPTLKAGCPSVCPVDAKGKIFGKTCLKKWGKCVKKANLDTYGKPSEELKVAENYKCWRPSCPEVPVA